MHGHWGRSHEDYSKSSIYLKKISIDSLISFVIFVCRQDNSECSMNFPRSRSAENLERRVMDVAATTLDVVSEKIEKLHVN